MHRSSSSAGGSQFDFFTIHGRLVGDWMEASVCVAHWLIYTDSSFDITVI